MNANLQSDIIKLYGGYGFEYRPDFSEAEYLVFTINYGVFDNAIILKLKDNLPDNLNSDLEDLGFQVKIEKFYSLEETENNLFSGFFSIKKTKAAFKRDYDKHISNILAAIPSKEAVYKYIQSPFTKDLQYFNEDILQNITSEVSEYGPKLILIEAAAGFGKTCTAYEIGKLLSERDDQHIVLFAELSRDRQAKIFNHVLHKEVARSFPAVSQDLVIREIKKGKIIVILDGFDELLNEKINEEYQFERSQAMLETIGEILNLNAKVILTTRKTAILQGDDFDEWISDSNNKFNFTRYSLKEPSVKNWLNHDRSEAIESARINLKNLSNPVLLTFLKYIDDETFTNVLNVPDKIVDKYFDLILKREIERQELRMTQNEQSQFLTRLAVNMMLSNITRKPKEDIIEYFTENEIELIEMVRAKYSADIRPDFEAMLEKLSNHALLDRSNIDEKIGFVNNFVLGYFLSINLMETDEEWLADSIFLEATVNAYSAKILESRILLWSKLKASLDYATDEDKVRLELRLLDRVAGTFENSTFSDILFETEDFFKEGKVYSCIFNECTFTNCNFNFNIIQKSIFVSCTFYNCTSSGSFSTNEFISPNMDEVSTKHLIEDNIDKNNVIQDLTNEDKVKAYILEKFWPIGKDTVAFAHRPMFIFYRGGSYPTKAITDALDELRKEGILISAQRKNWIGLNMTGHNLNLIKNVLGRA